jgi:FkbM family methyltransferase
LRIEIGGSNPAYAFGLSEPHVQHAIAEALEPGAIFFDVGANVGFFTLIGARAVGPAGHVFAFEPNPSSRAVLERNAAANGFGDRISVLPCALGSAPGRAMFASRNVLTARLAPNGDLSVEVRALDDLALPRPNLVKIDVEGEEEAAIEGMRRILALGGPTLIVETHDESTRVPEMLEAAGYSVTQLEGEGMPHLLAYPGRTPAAVPE